MLETVNLRLWARSEMKAREKAVKAQMATIIKDAMPDLTKESVAQLIRENLEGKAAKKVK